MDASVTRDRLAAVLRALRTDSGMTGKEVVQRLRQQYGIEISEKTLYGYENNVSMPTIPAFLCLCKIYNVEDFFSTFAGAVSHNIVLSPTEERLVLYFREASPEAQALALKMLKPESKDTALPADW